MTRDRKDDRTTDWIEEIEGEDNGTDNGAGDQVGPATYGLGQTGGEDRETAVPPAND